MDGNVAGLTLGAPRDVRRLTAVARVPRDELSRVFLCLTLSIAALPEPRKKVLTWAPPLGWCSMMRLWGRDRRWPGAPAATSSEAMLAAWPTARVETGHLMYCMVS